MKLMFVALVAGLHIGTSLCAPILPQEIEGRSVTTTLAARQSRGGKGGSGNTGGNNKTPSASAVQQAADNFAGDVSVVSNSLNTLGTTTDQATRKKLANAGFKAESDEDNQRSVLFAAGNNGDANTKIVDNTPIVLDGLSSIAKDPSDDNTAKQLQTMEKARNANILPSITSLTNSAFKATGIDSSAQKFQSTTGSQSIKATIASGSSSTSQNSGANTSNSGNGNSNSSNGSSKNNGSSGSSSSNSQKANSKGNN